MLDFLLIESFGGAKKISDIIKCVSIFNWGVEKWKLGNFWSLYLQLVQLH